jgi:hypothetical protein
MLMKLRLLRLVLGFAAFAWGISIVGVFLSWSAASQALQGLGAQPIAYDRMLDYWLRMAAGAFALVGCWFLVLMIWPQKFHAAIPWFGGLVVLCCSRELFCYFMVCAYPFHRFHFMETQQRALLAGQQFYI